MWHEVEVWYKCPCEKVVCCFESKTARLFAIAQEPEIGAQSEGLTGRICLPHVLPFVRTRTGCILDQVTGPVWIKDAVVVSHNISVPITVPASAAVGGIITYRAVLSGIRRLASTPPAPERHAVPRRKVVPRHQALAGEGVRNDAEGSVPRSQVQGAIGYRHRLSLARRDGAATAKARAGVGPAADGWAAGTRAPAVARGGLGHYLMGRGMVR